MQKEVKKSKSRNSIQQNIFVPFSLKGNYVKVSEDIITRLFKLDEKSKKYIISAYLYIKIKLNESPTNRIKTSIRELANALNSRVESIHHAVNMLKSIDNMDIKIYTTPRNTIISSIEKDYKKFIPFEKSILKELFQIGVNATSVYTFIYTNMHQITAHSKGLCSSLTVTSKVLAYALKIGKNQLPRELDALAHNNFIHLDKKRKQGNIVNLLNTNINKDYIDQEKIIIPYTEQSKNNNPLYGTTPLLIIPYTEQSWLSNPLQESRIDQPKEPPKELYLKEPKEEEVFLNSKEEVREDSNSDKIDKIEKKIRHLEKLRIKFLSKLHYNPDLRGFIELKSKYYDDKFEVYRLYYKEDKIYVLYGDSMIDMDNYINYTRMAYQENHPTYVKSPKYWKQAFIRDFDKRKKIHEKNNYELRILKYIQYIRRTAEEDIVNKIKSLERSISKLSPMNNIINNSNRKEKDKNQSNLDTIKSFQKEHPDIFYKINEEVTNFIKQHKLNVTPEYLMTLLMNRINAYKEGKPVNV